MLRDLIPQKTPISCTSKTSVTEVARLMAQSDVGAIMVCEADKPIGIITDRDIVLRCIARHHDCSKEQAADIMSPTLKTVKETDGLYDVVACMRQSKIRRVPVVSEDGRLRGLISQGDVFALLARELHDLSIAATGFERIDQDADKKLKKAA